ncbi:hypothetical protein SteCoe_22051 [Stentor coeruleus]|uniref:non-specific serine/threonine protein kinase n=1 Tax=Stentor coeruleus TaxID=5963 RepID=A0A1R2BNQ9_9CILI|nr:hypothetical protein SteCoe_22051 [Stentor coeruleus]
MGGLCSKSNEIPPVLPRSISKEEDLTVAPGNFVKENTGSFYNYYKLANSPLGSGAWGEVRTCTLKSTEEIRVVKIISKTKLPQSMINERAAFHEANIIKKLDHPNLPRIYEFFEDEHNYFIVLEYIKGGDLFDRIVELKSFSETQASQIILQILLAVNYLHNCGIVHRDIKPENILMNDFNSLSLKLVDFDTATVFRNTSFRKMFGTPLYMAPEIVKGKYNEKCDLWSCGIILFILLTGRPPFKGSDDEILARLKNMKLDFRDKIFKGISEEAMELLKKLLEVDPNKRISASEACLHPWLANLKENVEDSEVLDILKNIKNFRGASKLKTLIHTFIISKIADPDQYKTELAVFHLLDANRDGKISKDELIMFMADKKLPVEEAEMYAELIMEHSDINNSGYVDYTEFLRASVNKYRFLTKENILNAFKILDQDKSGTIEVEELRQWIIDDGSTSIKLVENIIEKVDKNGDGKIDQEEFENMLIDTTTRRKSVVGVS